MKVAVYDRYWATAGGGETFAAGVAHALADDHEVTLLAHEPVDTAWLGERLAVDLSGVEVQQVGPAHHVERASRDHDLLINLSFKSSDRNGARRGLYVVHFPHDRYDRIPPRQTALLHRVGPIARLAGATSEHRPSRVRFDGGFHDPDVVRVAKVHWTDGDGEVLVSLPPGRREQIHVTFASLLPDGRREDAAISVDGTDVGSITIGSVASKRDLIVPTTFSTDAIGHADGSPVVIGVRSATWTPDDVLGNGDRRALGVPVTGVAVGRSPLGRARAVASLFDEYPPSLAFLDTYDRIVANSRFTRRWIRRWWNRDADVLYPPITERPATTKEPIVLSVGRFFAADRGHSKKQLEMVEAWRRITSDGSLGPIVEREGWTLHLVGGCGPDDRPYLDAVRQAADGLPVELHVDAPGATLDRLYRSASIYWHAAGLDEDEEANPERMEHFGITTVEAMSAGAVPVAYAAAGPLEAFRDGVEGFHFRTVDELITHTAGLLHDPARRAQLGAAAVERARAFGQEAFARNVRRVVDELG
jgi:glycosyltransferase involved in cell wall biosynthesis